jgi:twitching motility protein PilJ
MGFASKLTLDFLAKDKDGVADGNTVLASPDTQFGVPSMAMPAPLPPLRSHEPAPAATKAGFGQDRRAAPRPACCGRKRAEPAAAPAAVPDDDLRLPLIGHLSLPRQLRILLLAFVIGILLTILSLWRMPTAARSAPARPRSPAKR